MLSVKSLDWKLAYDFFPHMKKTDIVIEKKVFVDNLTIEIENQKLNKVLLEGGDHEKVVPIQQSLNTKEQVLVNKLDKIQFSQELIDKLRTILIKSHDKGQQISDGDNMNMLEESDRHFIYLLHFNFVYFRSMMVEFMQNQNTNLSLMTQIQQFNIQGIQQLFDALYQKNQQDLLISNFEPYEITLKQCFEFYLKLSQLLQEFKNISSTQQLTNHEQNYLVTLCFESQEIYQNLDNTAKRELSDLQEHPFANICEKQLIEIIRFVGRSVEKLLDLSFLSAHKDNQSGNQRRHFSPLMSFNQILYFDYHEQQIQGRKKIKGSDKLFDLVDIGTCNGIENQIKKLIQQLNQNEQKSQDTQSNKQLRNQQRESQFNIQEIDIYNFRQETTFIMKMLHKRKSSYYTKILQERQFFKKK